MTPMGIFSSGGKVSSSSSMASRLAFTIRARGSPQIAKITTTYQWVSNMEFHPTRLILGGIGEIGCSGNQILRLLRCLSPTDFHVRQGVLCGVCRSSRGISGSSRDYRLVSADECETDRRKSKASIEEKLQVAACLLGALLLGSLAPALARRILGVGTYIIATRPLEAEQTSSLLPSAAAVADVNWILDYFRPSADRRILFGGRVSYSAFQPPHLAESMRRRMVRIFPELSAVEVEYAWGGYLDITRSRAPDFGRLSPNVYYLQGFSGHGMSLTVLAGRLAAQAVAGTAERFDVFARLPHRDFPGGPLLRRPSLVLAMLYYRLKDLL